MSPFGEEMAKQKRRKPPGDVAPASPPVAGLAAAQEDAGAPPPATSPERVHGFPADPPDSPRLGTLLAAGICFGVSVLYFLPAFLPGRHIFGTDYLAGGYFFHEFISDRFAAGALPKWVPYVYGGLPLFSNPGATYHPFRHLGDLFFPVTGIYPTIYVLQFFVAGLGMYLLARELGVRSWAALVAGLAFEFTGLMMSFVYAGHDGRIMVATSAPLFFFFLHRGIRTGGLGPFIGAAATLGFSLLSFQIQSNYYVLLGGLLWALFCLWHFAVWRRGRALAARVAFGLGAVAFAFLLASVNFYPFLDYVGASPRGGDEGPGYEYSISFSMPPEELLGLAVPEQAGLSISDERGQLAFPAYDGRSPFKLHTEYVGAVVLALAILSAVYARRERYWWFFVALALFGLSISLGGFTPIYRLYYELLPGTKRFRAPNISFFLVSMALVTLAALGLERLAQLRDGTTARDGSDARDAVEERGGRPAARKRSAQATRRDASTPAMSLVLWILGGAIALVVLGAALAGGDTGAGRAAGWLRFGVFLAATTAVLWLWLARVLPTHLAAVALALLTIVDLWVIDRKFFMTVEPPETMFAADNVVDFLRAQPEPQGFRTWVVPSGMLPPGASYGRGEGNFLMHWKLRQAGGEHPLPLQVWVDYVGKGPLTLPDFHNLVQHPRLLDAANVKYIVLAAELEVPGWREASRGPYGIVYENVDALPLAWLASEARVVPQPDGAIAAMQQPDWEPGRTVLLYEEPPIPLTGGPPGGAATLPAAGQSVPGGSASMVEYDPDRIVIRTEADQPAILVIAEPWYTGWTARVDDEAARLLQANHAFRAVAVPAGSHTVVLSFEPATLRAGLVVYGVGLLLLIVYAAWSLAAHVRARRRIAVPG